MPLDPTALDADREERHIPDTEAEDQLTRWFRWGAAAGLVLFLVVLTGGRTTLLSCVRTGAFYDSRIVLSLDASSETMT